MVMTRYELLFIKSFQLFYEVVLNKRIYDIPIYAKCVTDNNILTCLKYEKGSKNRYLPTPISMGP